MVLKDKPHIKRMYGVWCVFIDWDWRYKPGSPPYESLAHALAFVDNYTKGIDQPDRMLPIETRRSIEAIARLGQPKQTTWSPLIPFKQVLQQVHGVWTKLK